ncbi:MAG: hypothetical protein AB8G05_05240 [Oligoflexales bacterium]
MNFIKKCTQIYFLLFLQLGLAYQGYSKDIYIFCYLKNSFSDYKRFAQPILTENDEPIIIDGKYDDILREYIIAETKYDEFYNYCSTLVGSIFVDLKGISTSTSNPTFLFSLGPQGLSNKSKYKNRFSQFFSGFSSSHQSLERLYKKSFKGIAQIYGKNFDADHLDAQHSFDKLTKIYKHLPMVQEYLIDEDPELRAIRQQFSLIPTSSSNRELFISQQVFKDFSRFHVSIFADGQRLYHNGSLDKANDLGLEQAFDVLEQFYNKQLDIPLRELRGNIGLAFHTRTHGFDNQSVDLIEHFLGFGKNMDFKIGNSTHSIHLLELDSTSINMKTQTELELSAPDLKENASIQIGRFLVIRSMNFDMLTGRCGEQRVTIRKKPN